LISACLPDSPDYLLAPEFLHVIGGAAGAILQSRKASREAGHRSENLGSGIGSIKLGKPFVRRIISSYYIQSYKFAPEPFRRGIAADSKNHHLVRRDPNNFPHNRNLRIR